MKTSTRAAAALLVAFASGTASLGAIAQARPPGHWHGDIARFHERDWDIWRGGHWIHGTHTGRLGWWWVAGGVWYFYPAPVYPYPNPYEPPPAVLVAPAAPPPTQFWYFCDAAQGYYPYVPACPGGWRQVPATPPPPQPAPPR